MTYICQACYYTQRSDALEEFRVTRHSAVQLLGPINSFEQALLPADFDPNWDVPMYPTVVAGSAIVATAPSAPSSAPAADLADDDDEEDEDLDDSGPSY